jgi:hypothetical protein
MIRNGQVRAPMRRSADGVPVRPTKAARGQAERPRNAWVRREAYRANSPNRMLAAMVRKINSPSTRPGNVNGVYPLDGCCGDTQGDSNQ